jgi:YjzC-like protein
MPNSSPTEKTELFKPGQKAKYSGEYIILDAQGNQQGEDIITLDEGDEFPEVKGIQAFYQLTPTCPDGECEVIGQPTPDVD